MTEFRYSDISVRLDKALIICSNGALSCKLFNKCHLGYSHTFHELFGFIYLTCSFKSNYLISSLSLTILTTSHEQEDTNNKWFPDNI